MRSSIIFLSLFFFSFVVVKAQDGFSSKGNFMIHNTLNGQGMVIHANYVIDGIVRTKNTINSNKLIFEENSSWSQKNLLLYIDGHVKSKKEGAFVFPIGNKGLYSPLALSDGQNALVSYKREIPMNPKIVDTSSLFTVSELQYWNVSSLKNAKVTLTYDTEVLRSNGTSKRINGNRLTLVGWDGYKWIRIPSAIDEFMLDTSNYRLVDSLIKSDYSRGSITSTIEVPLIYFSAFALGIVTPTYERESVILSSYTPAVEDPGFVIPVEEKVVIKPETVKTSVNAKVAKSNSSITKSEVSKKEVSKKASAVTDEAKDSFDRIVLSDEKNKDYRLIKKIHFAFNRKDLSEYSTNILYRVAEDIQKLNGDYRLKLEGRADMFGSDSYNYKLGLDRAETIKKFLFDQGITNVGIEVTSLGESESKVDCVECKASEMIENRRVDIYVIQQKK